MTNDADRSCIFIASDSPATKVPGARASRYRVYGVIGLHIGNATHFFHFPVFIFHYFNESFVIGILGGRRWTSDFFFGYFPKCNPITP